MRVDISRYVIGSFREDSFIKMEKEGIICFGNVCFIMSFFFLLGFWLGNIEKD